MAISMDDYKDDFSGTGVDAKEPIKPEDEFFHAVYIGHTARKNHIGIIEESGKFHIRGVQYNLDEVNMIITLSKKILVKTEEVNKKDQIKCFSFQEGEFPYKGTSGNICGMNANERALNPFCVPCRAQIIVTGILCDPNGTPYKTEEGKPIFGFIRGKGMRYSGVSDHLNNLVKLNLSPIVQPVTEESKEWEKKHINQSRVITKITRDIVTSSFNSSVNIFKFEIGAQLPDKAVERILDITKQTIEKFKDKFDWSKSRAAMAATAASSYAGPTQAQTFGTSQSNPEPNVNNSQEQNTQPLQDQNSSTTSETKQATPDFGFDDIDF